MEKSLANKMRPKKLSDIVGQEKILSENSFLINSIKKNMLSNIILFGPPGCGKTSIAYAYAEEIKAHAIYLNATINNKKDIEDAIIEAKNNFPSVLIIDEIHRLNKDKQEIFLSYLEENAFYLIGTTTSNPYYSINHAFRSRCYTFEVLPLSNSSVEQCLRKAISSENGLNNKIKLSDKQIQKITSISNGDLRYAYNTLELIYITYLDKDNITDEDVNNVINVNINNSSKDDNYYNYVSGLQKSIRGSDVNAALYYLSVLCALNELDAIKRRLVITAYEDVGLANPQAVDRVMNALKVVDEVGLPEALIPLGFVVCDLALSPKSKAANNSVQEAYHYVTTHPIDMPEYLKLRPKLSEEYQYPYDRPDLWEQIQYLPNSLKNIEFYKPSFNSKYEKALNDNYSRLKNIFKSNNLKQLKTKK